MAMGNKMHLDMGTQFLKAEALLERALGLLLHLDI